MDIMFIINANIRLRERKGKVHQASTYGKDHVDHTCECMARPPDLSLLCAGKKTSRGWIRMKGLSPLGENQMTEVPYGDREYGHSGVGIWIEGPPCSMMNRWQSPS